MKNLFNKTVQIIVIVVSINAANAMNDDKGVASWSEEFTVQKNYFSTKLVPLLSDSELFFNELKNNVPRIVEQTKELCAVLSKSGHITALQNISKKLENVTKEFNVFRFNSLAKTCTESVEIICKLIEEQGRFIDKSHGSGSFKKFMLEWHIIDLQNELDSRLEIFELNVLSNIRVAFRCSDSCVKLLDTIEHDCYYTESCKSMEAKQWLLPMYEKLCDIIGNSKISWIIKEEE